MKQGNQSKTLIEAVLGVVVPAADPSSASTDGLILPISWCCSWCCCYELAKLPVESLMEGRPLKVRDFDQVCKMYKVSCNRRRFIIHINIINIYDHYYSIYAVL